MSKLEFAISFFQDQLKKIAGKGFGSEKFIKMYNDQINVIIDEHQDLKKKNELQQENFSASMQLANKEIQMLKHTVMVLDAICLMHGIERWQMIKYFFYGEAGISRALKEVIESKEYHMPGKMMEAELYVDGQRKVMQDILHQTMMNIDDKRIEEIIAITKSIK